jgi:hypothetical protein
MLAGSTPIARARRWRSVHGLFGADHLPNSTATTVAATKARSIGTERLAEIVDPERFPNLSEWLSLGPRDPDGYFDAKLGLIIGGLRAELP